MAEPVVVTFHGFERVERVLHAVGGDAEKIAQTLVDEFVRARRDALEEKPYPPERAGQTYIRTFNLKRSYEVIREASDRWVMVNRAPYSEYVVGDEEQQAWMHAGRWWTMRGVIEEQAPRLSASLAARYQAEIDKRLT